MNTAMKKITFFILAIILATAIALTSHIFLLKWLQPLINQGLAHAHIIHSKDYGHLIVSFAYITLLIPVAAIAFIYYFAGHLLPVKTRVMKGVLLGIILLLVKSDLIRQPVMNVLVGVPAWVSILQQIQVWVYCLAVTIIIALIIPLKNKST
jgi:hypothetical protein